MPGTEWPINTSFGPATYLDLKSWRFQAYGAVEEPLHLTYEEIRGLPSVTKILDHHCIDGWTYLGHEWHGFTLETLAERTRPAANVGYLVIECENNLSQTFPITQDLLFAYARNGQPLSRPGGFPLRVVAPGEYGYKSSKWIERVRFTVDRELDFWEKTSLEWGVPVIPPSFHPWDENRDKRKEILLKIFTRMTSDARSKRAAEHLRAQGGSVPT